MSIKSVILLMEVTCTVNLLQGRD